MKKDQEEMNIADNPLYHDTWKLLKKYRDVVWSLELLLSVRLKGATSVTLKPG